MALLQEQVLAYAQERAGLPVAASDITKDLGLTRGQVLGAAYHLVEDGLLGKIKSGIFIFDGRRTTNPLLEVVAEDGDRLVLKDEDGRLIIAQVL